MRQTLATCLQRGLSLIELLVTLSIAVILLTIGVPSFVDLMDSSKATSYGNDLLADLNYARSEAITRGVRVTVCRSNDASTCSGGWSNGWIVFANVNESGATGQNTRDGDDEVLRVHTALSSGWTLMVNGNVPDYMAFQPTGLSATFNNLGTGTFTFCKGVRVQTGNAVTVNKTGRARVTNAVAGVCT